MITAYVAGLFDGDGCVRRGEVNVTSCWRPTLDALAETYGGKVYQDGHDKHKAVYKWRAFDRATVRRFLEDVFPYLVEKRDQVAVALAYLGGFITAEVADVQLRFMKLRQFPYPDKPVVVMGDN